MSNILSSIRRTVTTTETIEDLRAPSRTPDFGFEAPLFDDFDDFDDVSYASFDEVFEDDDVQEPQAPSAPADRDFPISVELDVDGRKSNWSYGSVEEFARRIVATQDYYNHGNVVTLTITKR